MNGINSPISIYRQAQAEGGSLQFHGRCNDAAGLARALERARRANATAGPRLDLVPDHLHLGNIGSAMPVMVLGDPRQGRQVLFWAFWEPEA